MLKCLSVFVRDLYFEVILFYFVLTNIGRFFFLEFKNSLKVIHKLLQFLALEILNYAVLCCVTW